jgi:hypothetical protein
MGDDCVLWTDCLTCISPRYLTDLLEVMAVASRMRDDVPKR